VDDCLVCREHRGEVELPGGPLYEDELVHGMHVPPLEDNPRPYLGHLMVTPKRHAAGLGDLMDEEAQAVGLLITRLSRALRREGAEHIYSAVIGHGVPHLHIHLLPRYAGTPQEYWWTRVDEWPDAPHGGPDEIAALVARLRTHL
jgi:diadenosine tetraphosphate (Ap4A) HIT family hydrolase